MKKHFTQPYVLVATVLLFGIGWLILQSSGNNAPRYRTAIVERGNISQVISATGTLNPIQVVNVGTQVSGQINAIHVKVNDRVKKGQLLAEVDPAIPLAQLKQSRSSMETARSAYELATRDLERTRMLVKKDFLAKVDLERAEQAQRAAKNSYESQKTQVERDEVNLNYTKVTSPIDGVVITQEVTPGQTVASNFQTPNLFKIAGDLTKMKIEVNFSEADISSLKEGMPITFIVYAYPNKTFKGEIQTINLNATNTSGVVTYNVIMHVENEERLLLPGMTAYVNVTLSESKDVLRVPLAALRFQPPPEQKGGLLQLLKFGTTPKFGSRSTKKNSKDTFVYLLKDDAPEMVQVTITDMDESFAAVQGDQIAEGDTVITGLQYAGAK